jgi:hypothetical protein
VGVGVADVTWTGKDSRHPSRGEIAGDAASDLGKGDKVLLHGFPAGSKVTKVAGSSTDGLVLGQSTGEGEVFRLLHGHNRKTSDFLFG